MATFLVDDDPCALELLAAQLAAVGRTDVVAFERAADAPARLRDATDSVDLVFCDLQMPGIDGVEFLRHLADLGYRGGMVVVSGESGRLLQTVHKLARAHRIHMLAALAKPVSADRLRQVLASNASRTASGPHAAGPAYAPADLRRAIARGELVNHYQPKVDLASGALVGAEALVRWRHPQAGLVYPDRFIALAEEHGLIDDLTQLVLANALQQARRWRDAGLDIQVAVNVSMDNLAALDCPDAVARLADEAGVALSSLALEVTESRLMTDVRAPLDILTRLRLKRIGLSIDDFGTGYSSLAQLRDIPFDEIKLDRGFVSGAARDPSLGAIVGATLAMACQLGMQSVAEGVEDRSDWDFLRLLGCDVAQGYFIARPMPGDELPGWSAGWQARLRELLAVAPAHFAGPAGSPPRPSRLHDPRRIAALRGDGVVDTPAEPQFDRIVAEAAAACDAPVAMLSLVDDDRQWVKSAVGLEEIGIDGRQATLDRSLCATAIEHDGLFVVPDARLDPRLNASPAVTGEPHIRFYAGTPLPSPEGQPIGMLCVLDVVRRPGGLLPEQARSIDRLGRRAMELLDARRMRIGGRDDGTTA